MQVKTAIFCFCVVNSKGNIIIRCKTEEKAKSYLSDNNHLHVEEKFLKWV